MCRGGVSKQDGQLWFPVLSLHFLMTSKCALWLYYLGNVKSSAQAGTGSTEWMHTHSPREGRLYLRLGEPPIQVGSV